MVSMESSGAVIIRFTATYITTTVKNAIVAHAGSASAQYRLLLMCTGWVIGPHAHAAYNTEPAVLNNQTMNP